MSINKYTLKLYWEQVRKHKTSFFISLFLIPIASLFISTLLPYFLSQSIGGLTRSSVDDVYSNLWLAAFYGLVGVALNFIGFQALTFHESTISTKLRNATFKRIINKDMRFFVNTKVGSLTSRYIDFIRSHVTLQDLLIIRTLGFVLSVSIGLVILATRSWVLALLMLALIAVLIVEVRWAIKKRTPLRKARKELISEINGTAADSFTNNMIVKTFANEDVETKHFAKINSRYQDVFRQDIGFIAAEGSVRFGFMTVMQVVAIWISAVLVLDGKIDIAVAIFSLTYLQRLSSQIFDLGNMLTGYDQALIEASPMSEMLSQDVTVKDKPAAKIVKKITPSIKLSDVSYHYSDDDEEVLRNINLTIKPGEKVGLVGNSGAGKSTITHLLLRFADVTNGTIEIGGHDVRDITQNSLRKLIAYVPQEPMLFHRTLRENISYGCTSATDAEINEAARKANALEFIKKIPKGLDAIVGERGIKLSGGQRQRIAIARAILKNAPILVLDEATSALDSENERLIQGALTKLMKNRTSIVIAHRLSTISKLDRIIVLDDGKIIEEGTHNELLDLNGTYAKLWSHQSGGFIEE